MSFVEFGPIRDESDAYGVQRLALQDVRLGGFSNPTDIADPASPRLVARQRQRIQANPDNYTGAYVRGRLEGFMMTADWKIGDSAPYMTAEEKEAIKNGDPRMVFPDKLGIFGLVVDEDLHTDLQTEIADRFLHLATDRALHLGKTAIDVAFHDKDPIQPIALQQGFAFTGRLGESEVAFDLRRMLGRKRVLDIPQRLYEKPLDS